MIVFTQLIVYKCVARSTCKSKQSTLFSLPPIQLCVRELQSPDCPLSTSTKPQLSRGKCSVLGVIGGRESSWHWGRVTKHGRRGGGVRGLTGQTDILCWSERSISVTERGKSIISLPGLYSAVHDSSLL